jgi:hypothetical protein
MYSCTQLDFDTQPSSQLVQGYNRDLQAQVVKRGLLCPHLFFFFAPKLWTREYGKGSRAPPSTAVLLWTGAQDGGKGGNETLLHYLLRLGTGLFPDWAEWIPLLQGHAEVIRASLFLLLGAALKNYLDPSNNLAAIQLWLLLHSVTHQQTHGLGIRYLEFESWLCPSPVA